LIAVEEEEEADGKMQTGNGEYNTRIDAELVFESGWI